MKKRIVSSRGRTPKTGLAGLFVVRQLIGEVEQFVLVGHMLDPRGIVMLFLLRFTSESEIRKNTPFFPRLDFIEENTSDSPGDFAEPGFLASVVCEENAK